MAELPRRQYSLARCTAVQLAILALQLFQALASVVSPAHWPASRSACSTQRRSVSFVQPNVGAMAAVAAHWDRCFGPVLPNHANGAFSDLREYFGGRAMGHSSNWPSDKAGKLESGSYGVCGRTGSERDSVGRFGRCLRRPDLPGFFGPIVTGEWRQLQVIHHSVFGRALPGQREPASPASAPPKSGLHRSL